MKTMKAFAFCAALMTGLAAVPAMPVTTVFAEEEEIPTSGKCGDNLTWELDEATGTLTISGTGKMDDWFVSDDVFAPAPWGFRIKTAILEEGVTSIGNCAFANNELESITIPKSVTSIGNDAFRLCVNMEEIVLPDGLKTIGDDAFGGCGIKSLTIPDGVTQIGAEAFTNCMVLENVVLPESVTAIEKRTFAYCESLKEVTLPDNVSEIKEGAFMGCMALTSITIPKSVNAIGNEAFFICRNLKEIAILNPDCAIDDGTSVCNDWEEDENGEFHPVYSGIIRGYDNSTAEAYAKKYGYTFESLGAAPVKEAETGDLDGDSEIGVTDAQLALSAYVKGMTGSDDGLTDAQRKAADIDGDGELTITDAQLILNYYVQNTILGANATWDELLTK